MAKRKKDTMEFRFYELPQGESALVLCGESWKRVYGHEEFHLHFHNLMMPRATTAAPVRAVGEGGRVGGSAGAPVGSRPVPVVRVSEMVVVCPPFYSAPGVQEQPILEVVRELVQE